MNSSAVDWYGHLRVNLHLNYFILNSIPIPIREHSKREERMIELAAGLALAADGEFGDWSGLADPILAEEDRALAVAEIDAISTLLYGLEDEDLPLVFRVETRPDINKVLELRRKWA
jgi:hypothetical protein